MSSAWFKWIHLVLKVWQAKWIDRADYCSIQLCSQHHRRKTGAYNSTFLNRQTINNLHESIAPGYKSRESKEQWHFKNNLIKVTFIQGCK